MLGHLHGHFIHRRRVTVLATHLASLIPRGASVLDVGCGDGALSARICELRPDIRVSGVDVLRRSQTQIPMIEFDGVTLPATDRSVDIVMFVDVLHHTDDPSVLLKEAVRVARRGILVKDHNLEGWGARPTLRAMDWVGNAKHGVALPYNYWTHPQWSRALTDLHLKPDCWQTRLRLYPAPFRWIFERDLHFVALLTKT